VSGECCPVSRQFRRKLEHRTPQSLPKSLRTALGTLIAKRREVGHLGEKPGSLLQPMRLVVNQIVRSTILGAMVLVLVFLGLHFANRENPSQPQTVHARPAEAATGTTPASSPAVSVPVIVFTNLKYVFHPVPQVLFTPDVRTFYPSNPSRHRAKVLDQPPDFVFRDADVPRPGRMVPCIKPVLTVREPRSPDFRNNPGGSKIVNRVVDSLFDRGAVSSRQFVFDFHAPGFFDLGQVEKHRIAVA